MMIPGVGTVTQDGDLFLSEPRRVPVLGRQCRFTIDGYESEHSASLLTCIEAFCSLRQADLWAASEAVFAYYRDVAVEAAHEPGFPLISTPTEVWDLVTFTDEPWLLRDGSTWFVVLDNECTWEPEHGLMLVFAEGRQLTKVSQFDGHLTNRHAYVDGSIPESVLYWNPNRRR